MPTDKQLCTNRANAQKPTGPRTAAGKVRAATNSVRRGFRARATVLPGEDPSEFLEAKHQPAGHAETFFVRRPAARG
jgi:hypothetical protein